MSRKLTKEDLKNPDQLLSIGRTLFIQTLNNQKLILSIIGGILLLGFGLIFIQKNSENKELAVQEKFYVVEKAYQKKKESFERAEQEKKNPDLKKNEKSTQSPAVLATGDLTKDYGTEIEGWTQMIDSAPASKAAAMAAIELSDLYLKYDKKTEASQILSKVKAQQNSDQLLGAMVFHAYASVLSKQEQCQEAISIWEKLENKKELNFLVEQAQLGRALCLESLGQSEKAEALLKEIVSAKNQKEVKNQENSKSQAQRSAEKFLRFFQLKKNMNPSKS